MANGFDGRVEARFTVPASTTISVTTNAGGPTTVTLTAGSYFMSAFVAQLQADLIAQRSVSGGTWTVTLSTGASGTGQVTITATNGTWSISWTSTTLRDVLGFTANITGVTGAQTGTKQAKGVWIPDCPLFLDGIAQIAPKASDFRATVGPTGVQYSLVGNVLRRHRNLVWQAVPLAKIREGSAALANASLEQFLDDAQLQQGHAWFTAGSLMQIYNHNAIKLGLDANSGAGVGGWTWPAQAALDDLAKRLDSRGWDGLWTVTIPQVVSSG